MLKNEVRQFGARALGQLHEVGNNMQIDAVVIASDHSEFKIIDWEDLGKKMRHKVIVDGRNCIDLSNLRHMGWRAYGI